MTGHGVGAKSDGTIAVIDDEDTGSWVTYVPDFLARAERWALQRELEERQSIFSTGQRMNATGELVAVPRLAAAFGDAPYEYPDLAGSLPWPSHLGELRARLVALAGHHFNYALVNWYRDGDDYTGWHSDKMHLHEPRSTVVSLSLGATRVLRFRRSGETEPCASVQLAAGSILWMGGKTQAHFEHSVPADPGVCEHRISATFRYVLDPASDPT